MIAPDETFDGTFPFAPHFAAVNGFRLHYVDEGAGEPIVCLHGEPTWGYLYRKLVGPLSRNHRVIVPDHMGFGKSETPLDREYTLATHVANLSVLVERLDLRNVTLVMQDWGGPIGTAFALRHPHRIRRMIMLNTLTGYGLAQHLNDPTVAKATDSPRQRNSRWFQWVLRSLREGSYTEVMGNLGTTVLSVMKLIGFENSAAINDTWTRAYASHFISRSACKGAIEFPLDAALGRITPFVKSGFRLVGALSGKPAILIEGMRDCAIVPELAIRDFELFFPGAPVVRLPEAGHFSQEDAPAEITAHVLDFLARTS